ncbi:YheT family hydrolase [Leeia sp.]|uniref:YheT family hydrolase n=1 Tax=Leeia sp. TaxID=2884678 RepID=UPI0035B4793A
MVQALAPAPSYRAPRWLRGSHAQTIIPALWARRPRPTLVRTLWTTPDQDRIALDSLYPLDDTRPMLVLFHGLEGSSRSNYAAHLLQMAARQGWQAVVPHFRGCGGIDNLLPRAYHAGDSAEIDWIVRRLVTLAPTRPILLSGVSLGANAMLKWLGEQGAAVPSSVRAAAAISAPMDLGAAGACLDQGINRHFYAREFLRTLKPKVLLALQRHPQLAAWLQAGRIQQMRTLKAFDDYVTAPMHGFAGVEDYWRRASSKPLLPQITIPTLLLNARNDPFIPANSLPAADEVSPAVKRLFPQQGGHAGFLSGSLFHDHNNWLPHCLLAHFGPLLGSLSLERG